MAQEKQIHNPEPLGKSLTPLFASQLQSMAKPKSNEECFIVDGQIVSLVEVCGHIQSIKKDNMYRSIVVADSTGAVTCRLWNIEDESKPTPTDYSLTQSCTRQGSLP